MYSKNAAYKTGKLKSQYLEFVLLVSLVSLGTGCSAQHETHLNPVTQTQVSPFFFPFEESPRSSRFTDERIRDLTHDQIRSLSHEELQEITTEQMSLLRPDQVYALTQNQILSLRPDQLEGILRGIPEIDVHDPISTRLVPSLHSERWRMAHNELNEDPTLNFAYVGRYHEYLFYLGRAGEGQFVELIFQREQLESYGGYGPLF